MKCHFFPALETDEKIFSLWLWKRLYLLKATMLQFCSVRLQCGMIYVLIARTRKAECNSLVRSNIKLLSSNRVEIRDAGITFYSTNKTVVLSKRQ